jgi:hypothetical protein
MAQSCLIEPQTLIIEVLETTRQTLMKYQIYQIRRRLSCNVCFLQHAKAANIRIQALVIFRPAINALSMFVSIEAHFVRSTSARVRRKRTTAEISRKSAPVTGKTRISQHSSAPPRFGDRKFSSSKAVPHHARFRTQRLKFESR